MIVCICRRISERTIAEHAREGLDFDDIQMELGVATQCGMCEESVRDIIADCQRHILCGGHQTRDEIDKIFTAQTLIDI